MLTAYPTPTSSSGHRSILPAWTAYTLVCLLCLTLDTFTPNSKDTRHFLTAVAATAAAAASTPPEPPPAAETDTDSLPGHPVPEFEDVAEWVRQHGGQVNVVVRQSPGTGRFVVAPRQMKSGDVFVAVPLKLCLETAQGDASAAFLWAEIKDPKSKFAPYIKTLPPRDGVMSYYDIPTSYLPLIQHETLDNAIKTIQSDLQDTWDADQEAYRKALGPDITIEDIRYSQTLLETRAISLTVAGERLLPVYDMANHRNDCPHRLMSPFSTGPCPGSSKRDKQDCLLWTARADVAEGEEVCNRYTDYLLQDRSLLQYGFLQDGSVIHELSGIDRHDFDPDEPWRDPPLGKKGKPKRFKGTKAQTRLEIARLASVLQGLQDRDKEPAVTAIQADKERDQQGYLLASLWKWRRQRQAAIQRELRRLRKVVGEDAAAAVSGKGASGRAFEEADGGEGLAAPKTEL